MPAFYACPGCGAPLFAAKTPDVTMLCCKQCAGIWLDNVGSRMAAEARLSEFAQQVARILDESRPGVRKRPIQTYREPAEAAPTERRCPTCTKPLSRAFVQLARSELDICPAHGTFFDRHELWGLIQAASVQQLAIDHDHKKELRAMLEMQREAGGSGWSAHGVHHHDRDIAGLLIEAILDFD